MQMFGLDFFDKSKTQLLKFLEQKLLSQQKTSAAFCDLNMLGEYLAKPEFSKRLKKFNLVMADGSAITLLKKTFFNKEKLDRIPGPDFFKYFIELDTSYKHFFLGTNQVTLEKVIDKARTINPDIQICGYHSPPFEKKFSEKTNKQILTIIDDSKPDILWVSLGCPKQENWIFDNFTDINAKLIIAVGAAIDFYSGNVKRAPLFFRKLGLEFLYRLLFQPRIIIRVFKGSYRIIKNIYKIRNNT